MTRRGAILKAAGAHLRGPAATAGMTLAVLAACAGYGHARFGSAAAALAYVNGDRLLVDLSAKSLGDAPAGGRRTVRYALTNLSGRAVKILGARTSCSCAVVGGLPGELAAGETRAVEVAVTMPAISSDIRGGVDVYTDDPRQGTLKLVYTGRVVTPRGPQGGRTR